jgi:HSP20 family protein
MADAQSHTTPDNLSTNRRPRRDDDGAPVTNGEHRSFGAHRSEEAARRSDEMVDVARDLSQSTAQATREFGERSRQMSREMAANWRGAIEPFFAFPMEMNRWLEEMWGHAGAGSYAGMHAARPFSGWTMAQMFGLPAADVKETQNAYLLHVEVPGLSRDELDLSVRGDTLAICGHKLESKDDSGSAYRMSERRFGSFERRFPIPAEIDRDKIEARYRDGVLTVTLPKTEAAAGKHSRIEIKG